MKKLVLATLSLFILSTTHAQVRTKVYVSYMADTISSIDGPSHTFGKAITGLNSIFGPKLISSPDYSRLTIVDGPTNLFVIRTEDNVNIKAKMSDYSINTLKYGPNNQYLYSDYTHQLLQYDTSDLTIIDSFQVFKFKGWYTEIDFRFINDSILLYGGRKYNMNTRKVIDSTDRTIKYNAQYGDKLYYGNKDTLYIFDTDKMEVVDSMQASSNITTFISPPVLYQDKIYFVGVTWGNPNKWFIETFDPVSNQFLPPVEVEYANTPYLSPDGEIWMIDEDNKQLYVYSIKDKEITDIISVDAYPREIAFGKGTTHKSSINTITLNNINLYPNPANTTITLQRNNNEAMSYQITNSVGKLIMNIKSTSAKEEIDITTLPPGVYFVNVTGTKPITLKFIKL